MHTVIETNDARFQQHWLTLLSNDPLQNPLYDVFSARTNDSIEAPGSFSSGQHDYVDRSFVVLSQDEPVFGCRLTLHVDKEGRKHLGYFGLDAYVHVNQASLDNPTNNFCPEAIRLLQQHVDQLLDEEQPEAIDYLDSVSCGIMSPVTQVLLEKGAIPTVHQVQLIDLKQSSDELMRQLSAAYRGHIKWGRENLQLRIVHGGTADGAESEDNAAFPSSMMAQDQSFASYLKLLERGQGFLIQANLDERVAASALFVYSNKTCQFVFADILADADNGVAEKPVLHQVIWSAMLEAKYLGCEHFDFGYQHSASTQSPLNHISPQQFGGLAHTRLKVSMLQDYSLPPHAKLS